MFGLWLVVIGCVAALISLPFAAFGIVGLERWFPNRDAQNSKRLIQILVWASILIAVVIWVIACVIMATMRL